MLEAEWAFVDRVETLCDFVETMLKAGLSIESLNDKTKSGIVNAADPATKWPRITYTKAISLLESADATFEFTPAWGKPLQSEHERWLAEDHFNGPVFVTDYPANMKPFYMRLNDDGQTAACFDLLIPSVGELVGGSLREERLSVLEQSLERHNVNRQDLDWYLDLRQYGSVPHGGFGMGLERYIGWAGGIDNIRESIPMPRWAGRLSL